MVGAEFGVLSANAPGSAELCSASPNHSAYRPPPQWANRPEQVYYRTIQSTIERAIMNAITANEIKTRGVVVFEEHLAEAPEAVISVRGKERYVVMSVEDYREMREMELEAAWMRVKADLEAGRYRKESVEEHLARISAE